MPCLPACLPASCALPPHPEHSQRLTSPSVIPALRCWMCDCWRRWNNTNGSSSPPGPQVAGMLLQVPHSRCTPTNRDNAEWLEFSRGLVIEPVALCFPGRCWWPVKRQCRTARSEVAHFFLAARDGMELATTYNAIHYYMASAQRWMTYYYCRCFCVRFQVKVGADTEAGCGELSKYSWRTIAKNLDHHAKGLMHVIEIFRDLLSL